MANIKKFSKEKARWTIECTRDQLRLVEWALVGLWINGEARVNLSEKEDWYKIKSTITNTLVQRGRKIPKRKKKK